MFKKKMKYIILAILVFSSMMLTGCIPANEHVGKPAPNSYKDPYYGGYYGGGYGYYR